MMRYHQFSILLLFLSVFLSGCSTLRMREDVAVAPTTGVTYGTQVAFGDCALIERPEFAPIVGALVAGAISEGINRLGAALNEAAQKKEVSASANRNLQISKNDFSASDPVCLQLVRGWFYTNPFPKEEKKNINSTGEKEENKKLSLKERITATGWPTQTIEQELTLESVETLWRNGIWLAARPDFLFEGVFASSKDKRAQTVIPHYVVLNEPLFTRLFRPGHSRHIAVFFAFHKPSQAAEAKNHPAATFVLGKLNPKEVRRYPFEDTILRRLIQNKNPLPSKKPADSADTENDKNSQNEQTIRNRWPHESEWFDSLDLGDTPQPFKVSALITETQDASEFLSFVAAIFSGRKEEVTKELETTFVPDKRQTAKVEKEKNETALEEKIDIAVEALKACSIASSATIQNVTAARKTLREINAGAVTAQKALPVDQSCIDGIKQTDAPEKIAAACKNVLEKLQKNRSCQK